MGNTTVHLKNSVRRWVGAIAHAQKQTIVLSPFITSPTAETVVRGADPETIEIYTVFEALNFASVSNHHPGLRTGSTSMRTPTGR